MRSSLKVRRIEDEARQKVSQSPLSPSIGFHGRRLLQDTDSPYSINSLGEKTGGINSKLGTPSCMQFVHLLNGLG